MSEPATGAGGLPQPSASRDRDEAGRARNARPRDALGRPLARGAAGQPGLADEHPLPPEQALASAQELIDAGLPFHAHEVLEAAWKSAPPADRHLWQGLAQLAVGLTHALRGNARGAVALLRRGADRLSGYPPAGPHGIDVAGLRTCAYALAHRIEEAGLAAMQPGELCLQLVTHAAD
jgi:uncharacterized protein